MRSSGEHAAALVRAIESVPGAPRLRAWSAPGVGARVYFPGGAYVSIGRGGDVAATMRGAQTFDEKSLYPAQRRAFRDGLAIYLMQLKAHFEAQGREGNPVGKASKRHASTNAQRFEADVEKHLPRGVDVDFRTDPSLENWAKIDQIAAATPGKGHGSRAMEIICAKADEYGIRLELIVEADDEEDDEASPLADRLIRWYGRYGFFVTGLSSWGDNVLVRKPGALRHPAEREARKENPTRRASHGEPLFDVEALVQRPRHRSDDDEVPEIRKPEHGQKLYRGKKVAWIGEPGRMLKLGWDQVKPVQGNIFDPGKVAGFYEKIEAAAAAGKTMTFSAPPAWLFFVNHDDVAQTQHDVRHRPMDLEYERLTRPYTTGDDELDAHLAAVLADNPGGGLAPADRARVKAVERKKKGDLGQVKAQLRDANHRAFAAQLAGEPYLWVQVATGEENGFDPKKLT
jgi:hypothetical protein